MVYLNLDMVASPNAGYFVHGGHGRKGGQDGRGGSKSETGPSGSATAARIVADQLAKTGVTVQPIKFVEDSDYAPFVDAGIPSAAPFTGDEKTKTAEQAATWGGRSGEVFDRCYHQACDTVANINRTALERNVRATAAAVEYFASYNGPIAD